MLFNQFNNDVDPVLETASQPVVYTAEMVPVVKIDEGYYTEMNFLVPYMESNNIEYVNDALNNIASVNGLSENAVGLLIESDANDSVMKMVSALAEAGFSVMRKTSANPKK